MSGNKNYWLLFLLLFFSLVALGQQKTKEQLQKEREDNLKKIQEAELTLNQTSSKKNASVGQLNALKYQISVRHNVIKGFEDELSLLNAEINDNLEVIDALESDLNGLKKEYAAMIYSAYKASNGMDKLTFLFSAESFNQVLRRVQYMKQYGDARKKQVIQIMAVQQTLIEENKAVEASKQEKSVLLEKQRKENSSLVDLTKKEQAVLASLQKEEKQIKKELAQTKASIAALDKLISDLIKKEIAEAAKAKAVANNKASNALSADFSKNKLKLPWPAPGFISQSFGISRDPVLKMVERNSPGIEIQTEPGAVATSIFGGEVRAVALIQGFSKAVIVKHGDYFTVYAKLDQVYVQKGQTLAIGDKIGKVFTSSDGISELHFELWQSKENGTVKLDPELWLIKK